MNDDDIKYKLSFTHARGTVKLTPYVVRVGDKLIGMGRRDEYDENGVLISSMTEPTGVEMTSPLESPPWWKFWK